MSYSDTEKLLVRVRENNVDDITLISSTTRGCNLDSEEEKKAVMLFDLVMQRINGKSYKILSDVSGDEYIKVYIRHKDIEAVLGTQIYDIASVETVFSSKSDTKKLKIIKNVGRTYKLLGSYLLDGTQAAIYWALAPTLVPALMYISHAKKGDMFFITNT